MHRVCPSEARVLVRIEDVTAWPHSHEGYYAAKVAVLGARARLAGLFVYTF